MTEIIINHTPLSVKEYEGKRVVTFKDIDMVHGRADGTAGRAFRKNRGHFIEGEDFYKVSPDIFRRTIGEMDARQPNDITLITETGYLMLVKSFRDNLAWQVQRQLVNAYFRVQHFSAAESPRTNDLSDQELLRIIRAKRRAKELSALHRLSAQASIKQAEAAIAKASLMEYIDAHPDLVNITDLPMLGLEESHAANRI